MWKVWWPWACFLGEAWPMAQMVSHFDETDPTVIIEGFASGHNEEGLERIKNQVRSHAQLMSGESSRRSSYYVHGRHSFLVFCLWLCKYI